MRVPSIIAVILAITPLVNAQDSAETLTQADRDALLERLEKMESDSAAKTDARFSMAVSAFRTALSDEQGPVQLYLKCKEKIDFTNKEKKSQEFREWKRANENTLSKPAFNQALRYQLRWLLLSLQAASAKKDVFAFGPDASKLAAAVIMEGETLREQRAVLGESVFSTVFAQAYNIDTVSIQNWPNNPLDIDTLYEQVIFPPFREPGKTSQLRSAWDNRIQMQINYVSKWSKDPSTLKKFQTGPYLDLVWKMETDIFNAGDQRGAASRMFQHIERNISNPKAEAWAKQLKSFLESPPEPVQPANKTASTGGTPTTTSPTAGTPPDPAN
jgi:hypothetical protein